MPKFGFAPCVRNQRSSAVLLVAATCGNSGAPVLPGEFGVQPCWVRSSKRAIWRSVSVGFGLVVWRIFSAVDGVMGAWLERRYWATAMLEPVRAASRPKFRIWGVGWVVERMRSTSWGDLVWQIA